MSKEQTEDLLTFLTPFSEEQRETALWLRAFVWDLYPGANELIYDNYNALAFGWSVTQKLGHKFCSIAIGRSSGNLHFGFYWGSELEDPEGLLLGKGNQYRYILVHKKEDFPEAYIRKLLKEAYAHSLSKVKDKDPRSSGATITKSVSAGKRAGKQVPDSKN